MTPPLAARESARLLLLPLCLLLALLVLRPHGPGAGQHQGAGRTAGAARQASVGGRAGGDVRTKNMALPTSVTSDNLCGTVADRNITFTLSTVNDANGNLFYRDATSGKGFRFYGFSHQWQYYTAIDTAGAVSGTFDYASAGGQVATAFPLTGWETGSSGASPAPTFTAGSAAPAVTTSPSSLSLTQGQAGQVAVSISGGDGTTIDLSAPPENNFHFHTAVAPMSALASAAAPQAAFTIQPTFATPIISGAYSVGVLWSQGNNSGASSFTSVTVSESPAPPAPTFGTPTPTTVPVNVCALPTGASGINVQRSADNSTWAGAATNVTPSATYNDAGLKPGTTYYYRLATTDGFGNAKPGLSAPATTAAPPPAPPSAPPAPTFGTPTPTVVPVNVCALPTNAASLNVQRSTDGGATWAEARDGAAPSATFSDAGRTQGTAYAYRLAAVGPGGTTYGPSAPISTPTPDTTPPAFASASVNAAGTQITVNWVEAGSPPVVGAAGLVFAASGAPVALSGVTTTGLVTTATLSRTVGQGETCTVAYNPAGTPPGDFADSASPPNPVPMFGPQPVTNNSTQVAPPTISLTAPAAGAAVSGLVAVTATASGGTGGVGRVELYVNGNLVDTQAAPTGGTTYTLTWDSTPSGNGAYALVVRAYDHAAPAAVAQDGPRTVTASNAAGLGTEYFFGAVQTPAPGKTILSLLATLDAVPTTDARQTREIFLGVNVPGASLNFEADYAVVPVNTDVSLPVPGASYRLAVKLAARYVAAPLPFTGQVVKMVPLSADGTTGLLWSADGKLWAVSGTAAATLLLDTAGVVQSGETLRDVCPFAGRVYLALSGGPSPVATRLFAYDPLAGDESYSVYGFASPVTALCSAGGALFAGTQDGAVHKLTAGGALSKVCGGTTPFLPAPVARLLPVALAAGNAAPGLAAVLADGTVWDVDGSARYGATEVFAPPDAGSAQVSSGAVAGGVRYLGTGPGQGAGAAGDLFAAGAGAPYALAYPFPSAILALTPFAGTLYAGLSGDGRLYGKTLAPGAHTLAYGAATDPLDPGLTAITALLPVATPAGPALLVGGTGTGATLFRFTAPTATASALFGKDVRNVLGVVRQFA